MLSDLLTTFKHKHWTESSLCDFPNAENASEVVISHANTAFHSSPEEVGATVKNDGVPAATLTACRLALVKSPAASRAALQKYRATIDTALARLLEIVEGYEHTDGSTPLHEAVKRGDAATAQSLIAFGADFESRRVGCVSPLNLATNSSCREVLEEHSKIFNEVFQDPERLRSAAAAHVSALSVTAEEPLPAATSQAKAKTKLTFRAYHLEPAFLWAPSEACDEVFAWARNLFVVQLAASIQPFTDLPDDCAGDVLEFFELSMTHAELLKYANQCLSAEAHAWLHAVLAAAFATNATTRLLSAVENDDSAMVQDCIEIGVNVNVPAALPPCLQALIQEANSDGLPLGHTPLIIASCKGHTAVVKLLLEAGADTNILSPMRRYTALMTATEQGHTAVVKLLLEAGADTSVLSPMRNYSALMTAKELGHIAIVKLLEETGVVNLE